MTKLQWVALALVCALALPMAAQQRGPAASDGYRIAGVAINSTSNLPVARAHVTISLTSGNFSRTVTTGEDGRFAFDHLRAGKYALAGERRGFASQGYEQHEEVFSTAIAVGPNLDAGNLVFRLAPDASFSGRITDDGNEPVRNARVMLVHELMVEGRMGKHIVGDASADDQGRYHFAHLKPGDYYIAVSARPWYAQPPFMGRMGFRGDDAGIVGFGGGSGDGPSNSALDFAYPLTFYPDVSDAASASAITLQAGDRASADIMMRAVPALHVRLNNAAGPRKGDEPRQFVNATLVQTMFDGIEVPMQTMTRPLGGNASMISGVAPGHYLLRETSNMRRLRGMAQPATGEEQEQTAQEQRARVREVDLVSDTELDASEMAPTTTISGAVKLANGQAPSKPPVIELRRGAMRRSFGAAADANGEFAFPEGFTAGSYEVTMSSNDDLFIGKVTATGAKTTGRMLHIGGSEAVKLNIVASAGAGKVEGVALRDGKPQSGAMILLVPQDAENNRPLFRRDQSDSDGSFTLANVAAGRYTLLALEKGWELQWGDAAVLKPFLANGEKLVVEAKGKYEARVTVQ